MQEKLVKEIERTEEKLTQYTPGSRAHSMYLEIIQELEKRLPKPRVKITIGGPVCESCEG